MPPNHRRRLPLLLLDSPRSARAAIDLSGSAVPAGRPELLDVRVTAIDVPSGIVGLASGDQGAHDPPVVKIHHRDSDCVRWMGECQLVAPRIPMWK